MSALVESVGPGFCAGFDAPQEAFDVSKFPRFDYGMREVKRAGEIISGPLDVDDPNLAHVVEAFRIANNWRDAHAYPMNSIRHQIIFYLNTLGIEGLTAARLKRMQAIRRKIRRIGLNLNQIQDLGGVRAIVPSVSHAKSLAETLSNRSRHSLRKQDDYISKPKTRDGYRSHHLIFEYSGRGEASVYEGRRIEVQIRTRLQHSWATAVEAVGLFKGEDLKGNNGDERWLRLFKLMSAEFALAENCSEPEDVSPHHERVKDIKELDAELQATSTMENLSSAVRWTEIAVSSRESPSYYLIQYDNASNQVTVEPHFSAQQAIHSYDLAENKDNQSGEETLNIVLVEASKVTQLKEAYPNYFGDVQLFKQNLKRISGGKLAKDYSVKPQEVVKRPVLDRVDPIWMKARRMRPD